MKALTAIEENMQQYDINSIAEWNQMCLSKKKALEVLKDKEETFIFSHIPHITTENSNETEALEVTHDIYDYFLIQNGEIKELSLIHKYTSENVEKDKQTWVSVKITMQMGEDYNNFLNWVDENYPNATFFMFCELQNKEFCDGIKVIENPFKENKEQCTCKDCNVESRFTWGEMAFLAKELKDIDFAVVNSSNNVFAFETFVNGIKMNYNIAFKQFEQYLIREGIMTEYQILTPKVKSNLPLSNLFYNWLMTYHPDYQLIDFV